MTNAVIDRFEDDLAVLFVGDEQKPMMIKRSALPHGVKDGTWLQITVVNGVVTQAVINQSKTDEMAKTIAEKMERLRRGEQLK
jgi:hypothetical protein